MNLLGARANPPAWDVENGFTPAEGAPGFTYYVAWLGHSCVAMKVSAALSPDHD
jgi:hypothetical protein